MTVLDKDRFLRLWQEAGSAAGTARAELIFGQVAAHYAETCRRYHTADHIAHCLGQLDLVTDPRADNVAVELGVWFHDVVYRLGDPNNERRSADWFLELAVGDLRRVDCDKVWRMILATEHRQVPSELDARYLCDIDLSSFGLPNDEFLRDSRLVREELGHVPDEVYYPGQRDFLLRLLARDRIYTTDLFHDLYERSARANIAGVLRQIDARFARRGAGR